MSNRIKITKGSLVESVSERALKSYLDNGWVIVVEPEKPTPTTYDDYTTSQIIDIGKARGLNFEGLSLEKMKEALNNVDEKIEMLKKPTNEGFTDNLILD